MSRAIERLQVDVLPIERFNAVWRPSEPERLRPVYVERVTIREALRGDLWRSLFGPIELVEPTFGVRPTSLLEAASVHHLFLFGTASATAGEGKFFGRSVKSGRAWLGSHVGDHACMAGQATLNISTGNDLRISSHPCRCDHMVACAVITNAASQVMRLSLGPRPAQELLVLYRRKTGRNALAELKERIMGGDGAQRRLLRREPVTLRVLRDIPVPSWKLVFPDKLLQFRPLDGLRADLLTVAGAPRSLLCTPSLLHYCIALYNFVSCTCVWHISRT